MNNRSDLLAQLRAWLRGEARRSDEARLEERARTDEFLRDALSGYRAHPEHDHVAANERLRQRLRERTSRERRVIPLWTRYAAGVALLIVAAGLFYWVNQTPQQNLAQERADDAREQPADTPRDETTNEDNESAPATTDEAMEREEEEVPPPAETPAQARQEPVPPPPPVAPPEEEAIAESDEVAGDEMIESEEMVQEEIARDSRGLAVQKKEQARAIEAVPQEPIQRMDDSSPADYSVRSLLQPLTDSLRSFRFVDPSGQPVAGAQLQIRATREILGQSNQRGFVQTAYQEMPLQVQRQGYIPINIPPRTDTSALVVLQPVQPTAFKETRSRLQADTTAFPLEAYPIVGIDSLTRYVQDRMPYPRRLLRVYFTVDTEGLLSNPEPSDDFSLRLFQILQEGPVWVVPVGVDSVRTSFRY